MMVNKEDYHIPAEQKPQRTVDYTVRDVTLSGITCMGKNAIGVVGAKIFDVTLRDIDFIRKSS